MDLLKFTPGMRVRVDGVAYQVVRLHPDSDRMTVAPLGVMRNRRRQGRAARDRGSAVLRDRLRGHHADTYPSVPGLRAARTDTLPGVRQGAVYGGRWALCRRLLRRLSPGVQAPHELRKLVWTSLLDHGVCAAVKFEPMAGAASTSLPTPATAPTGRRWVCWCRGAADHHASWCDDCATRCKCKLCKPDRRISP